MALESGFGDGGPVPGKFAGLNPCHANCALSENGVVLMAESTSEMRDAKGFVRIPIKQSRYGAAESRADSLTQGYAELGMNLLSE